MSGFCDTCAATHTLPVTAEARQAALRLHADAAAGTLFRLEGKMLGVLVCRDREGKSQTLHAFSGTLDGAHHAAGFVGPTRSGQLTEAAEAETLASLADLSRRVEALDTRDLDEEIARITARFEPRLAELTAAREQARTQRRTEREGLDPAASGTSERLAALAAESGAMRAALKAQRRAHREALAPLLARREERLAERSRLRHERAARSRHLQAEMHDAHGLLNFAGRYRPVRDFFSDGAVPTGTGACCAPKLLQEAALRGWQALGIAEIWCGPSPTATPRESGRFYPVCREKCLPILGHLLCGSDAPVPPLSVLHLDEDLIVIDKPAGLLSTPGRRLMARDCAETRLRLLHPERPFLRAAHRLDAATSGVLAFACSEDALRAVQAEFETGSVEKEYLALVERTPDEPHGTIELALAPDLENRPRQIVDPDTGRAARTDWVAHGRTEGGCLLALYPATGRSHQLRVHLADPRGLGLPIRGDTLYGGATAVRLMLHARRLRLRHPRSGETLEFTATAPFGTGELADLPQRRDLLR